ncbi:hypothetical protein Mkiyose1665_26830 [Mycobacterium kiyosense]|uniref:TPR repeat domain-containing protein n=1 Tax=Mycobacterium kiyosense TaxID=2871094 RepID=A0A9P3Q359_9MYCO|nr:hypothetical protein [Mycobacterium kiyosense]GLB82259.1 hypothetical protein SRL2020028_15150 [Mycobacterium kiyosense]GLB95963.1 hypothetical protein SRL2020226_27390 [Mycobacterium kiyosense]GLD30028.1 hypothetical protein Mkiyose1413_19110 [Mycobacterium kiyosense]GLD35735.1 hypothetical protein Mkiyose1595_19550 [Mycobacterium kiyosense]GLD42183.1 hypothetical protein Mkiyose1665_26830 [Mycobacterium kiyosense]
MTRPQKSVVYKANANALGDLAAPTREVGRKMLEAAESVRNSVHGLDWKGDTQNACDGRADRELAQDRKVAAGYEALATAYENGKTTMQPMIDSLRNQAKGLENDSFNVSEDWVVTDNYNYGMGKLAMVLTGSTEQDAQHAMDDLKAKRGEEAKTATTNLQKLAGELGVADTNTKNAINAAKNDIGAAAPLAAGLVGGQQARDDASAVLAGNATPQQVARVRAALTSWTPEELAALASGRPANMPQGQFDYLTSLMQAMDGQSPAAIDAAMGKYGLQGAMGDGMRMMGNPNIHTALGGNGGLNTLPAKVRELLTKDPVTVLGTNPEVAAKSIPITQFNAMNDMLGRGNRALGLGSDVDRAMLNQASRIAAGEHSKVSLVSDPDAPKRNAGNYLTEGQINNTVSAMMSNASIDHQAVTDFLHAGPAMDRVNGGHFDNNQAFTSLATAKFGPNDHGWKDMLDWIGPNAHTPGFEGHEAAVAADSLAHLTANNHDLLGGRIPIFDYGDHPSGRFESLGQRDPELVQALTRNLTPYFGNLGGVEVPGIDTSGIPGFKNSTEFQNLFEVLSSDKASAVALQAAGASWDHYYAERFGETGRVEYARAAGQLETALHNGYQAELEDMKRNGDTARILDYNQRSADWDSRKGMLSDVFGALPLSKLPGGDALSFLGKMVIDGYNPYLKLDEIPPVTPGNAPVDPVAAALAANDRQFKVLTDQIYHDYSIVEGYEVRDPSVVGAFQNVQTRNGPVNFFVPDGNNGWKLDWNAVTKNRDDFIQIYSNLEQGGQLKVGGWRESYAYGTDNTVIDPVGLPDPGNVSTPPGR